MAFVAHSGGSANRCSPAGAGKVSPKNWKAHRITVSRMNCLLIAIPVPQTSIKITDDCHRTGMESRVYRIPTMSPAESYLKCSEEILECVRGQMKTIREVADLFAGVILDGRMVHVFGSGHSRILVEEMWPRYGSFPGFNPIVELSLTFHNLVVGANGQRQAMFLENVPGLARRILRNFDLREGGAALVVSSSGCNVVPVEMAEIFQENDIPVVGLVSQKHSDASSSKRSDGKKLTDFSDKVLDTGAPVGDAMVWVENLEMPVAPGSTVGGCLLVNAIKAEVAERLTKAGHPPKALAAGAVVGAERAAEIFEAAYDEHARRIARYYVRAGIDE